MSGIFFLPVLTFGALIFINFDPETNFDYLSGTPVVFISPACGPGDPGFNVLINANGFDPNSNVDWKLVNSDGFIPVYGYYQTNSTGGFNDLAFAGAVKNDHYKLYFGDDANNDKKFDSDGAITYANLTIPCT
jgi:hypothetical protein